MKGLASTAESLAAAIRVGFLLVGAFGCPVDDARRVEVRVFAASSLTESFRELAAAFEKRHPELQVELTFAGSQVLRLQIESGADPLVFASADEAHVEALVSAGVGRRPRTFAVNDLVLVTPASDRRLRTLEDLRWSKRIILGTKTVPIGRYAREVLRRADARYGAGFSQAVLDRVVSYEPNVRLVRAKVLMGEADAAFVYRTDARSPGLRVVAVDDDIAVSARYRLAMIGPTRTPPAEAFADFVGSEQGYAILREFGFGRP